MRPKSKLVVRHKDRKILATVLENYPAIIVKPSVLPPDDDSPYQYDTEKEFWEDWEVAFI